MRTAAANWSAPAKFNGKPSAGAQSCADAGTLKHSWRCPFGPKNYFRFDIGR
jgi:hypothetical protein